MNLFCTEFNLPGQTMVKNEKKNLGTLLHFYNYIMLTKSSLQGTSVRLENYISPFLLPVVV